MSLSTYSSIYKRLHSEPGFTSALHGICTTQRCFDLLTYYGTSVYITVGVVVCMHVHMYI